MKSKNLPTYGNWLKFGLSYNLYKTYIAYPVSKVLENLKDPTEKGWIAVKRILRYLKGIQEVGLVFGGKKARKDLEGWVDADWAGDVKSRLSRLGYVFKIAAGAINRSSKKQGNFALSTAEVEYVSGCLGTQEAIC
jgi:hypothetical protein